MTTSAVTTSALRQSFGMIAVSTSHRARSVLAGRLYDATEPITLFELQVFAST
ncbi:hypothetical protein [Streptomyces tsukubensis]|uniref:hypothetical protein n=1 Tax=Streptomyces tsukubensis TaxID=83656 RepID=UPI00344C3771